MTTKPCGHTDNEFCGLDCWFTKDTKPMATIRFTLIITTELNDWLKQQARLHNRSKTQEIVNILELEMRRNQANGGNNQDERWMALKGDKNDK